MFGSDGEVPHLHSVLGDSRYAQAVALDFDSFFLTLHFCGYK